MERADEDPVSSRPAESPKAAAGEVGEGPSAGRQPTPEKEVGAT